VLPLNVTQPVTYTWQASGQEPVTHTGGTRDDLGYTWLAPGTQTITVTASNADSTRSDVLTVEVIQPLVGVALDGPASGTVATTATLTATVSPLDASQPVQYIWQAAGQEPVTHTGGLSDTLSLAWTEPGTAVVTVTASNIGGEVQAVHSWPVYWPLAGVQLAGPAQGAAGTSYTFTASVSPGQVMQPLTYTWQVDGQATLTHTGGLSDTASFAWEAPGVYTLALTVENAAGVVHDQRPFLVATPPQVTLAGPETSFVGGPYDFLATVQPTATLPLTYVWQVDGQAVLTHTGGLSDTFTLTWDDYGPHTVTVIVMNAAGTSTGVEGGVYTRSSCHWRCGVREWGEGALICANWG
jgi:hypothetical protein